MPYIYIITNDVNGKQYIGKTTHNDINERWKEHVHDYKRRNFEIRPLYRAMNKYGIEHFHIEPIEYVEWTENLEEKEIYWIAKYDTYKNGYNATFGGDGKILLNYQLIIDTYKKTLNTCETSRILDIDRQTITDILIKTKAFTKEEIIENGKKNIPRRKIGQYDKDTGELLKVFESNAEAERQFPTGKHITDACQGRRKTAGGYIWKYINE